MIPTATPEILWHYCSTSSFTSIISNRSIRLSSLALSNDSMEGKRTSELLLQKAEQDSINRRIIEIIKNHLSWFNVTLDCLGFCLSGKRDMLSQWRGYAEDGKGLCIGFATSELEKVLRNRGNLGLPIPEIHKIEYREENQTKLFSEVYELIRKLSSELDRETSSTKHIKTTRADLELEVATYISILASKMYSTKGSAFEEEDEWRIIYPYVGENDIRINYYSKSDRIVPYTDISIADSMELIKEVYIGPKNLNQSWTISSMLNNFGYYPRIVTHAEASYR